MRNWSNWSSSFIYFRLLQITAFGLFTGRAWQHLTQGGPYRAFFWKEDWMKPIVTALVDVDWTDYVTSPRTDATIVGLEVGLGIVFASLAVAVFLLKKMPLRWGWFLMISGAVLLFGLAFCYFLDKNLQWGQWWEYSAQFGTPIFLAVAAYRTIDQLKWKFWMRAAVAVTFVCHGLYALGYYPQPGDFVSMMMNGFGMSEGASKTWLIYAGIADLIVAVGLFIPVGWIVRTSLWYMVAWGLLTTFARLYANFLPGLTFSDLSYWIPHVLYRFPHFMLPLVLLVMYRKESDAKTDLR